MGQGRGPLRHGGRGGELLRPQRPAYAFLSALENPLVDFSTFSFGSIKTCSAFGGSISLIRNNEVLYRKMKAIQDGYPKWPQQK